MHGCAKISLPPSIYFRHPRSFLHFPMSARGPSGRFHVPITHVCIRLQVDPTLRSGSPKSRSGDIMSLVVALFSTWPSIVSALSNARRIPTT
ncbi:hypothetical protein P171DRAFT_133598 [Karstenula rhodostoma CBS 690.94]|uniref:Uncharacterized protein n=1 Tax=Karstenula rhodostoma CBS 690.94 TaxID=1392251 RepID=A0A9P4U6X5_9PLEO|nr:hypothetical protein P171DRAFT_133598 [Karstenula rhodostoma CBS 690.94]